MLVLFTLLIVALAAGESPAGDGQCVEGDTNDPTCSSPDRAAGLDTAACCQRLGVCEQKALSMRLLQAAAEVPSRSPPRPTAIAAPAIAGTPLSDGLRALLTRDQEDESLPFLVSTGHSPANLTLTYVDDGDLSALVVEMLPVLKVLPPALLAFMFNPLVLCCGCCWFCNRSPADDQPVQDAIKRRRRRAATAEKAD